jgi:hypothetical protein
VKLAVMTENDPAFSADLREPFVVWRVLLEAEFVLGIVVVLN